MSRRRIRRRSIQDKWKQLGRNDTTVQPTFKQHSQAAPDHPVLKLQRTIGNKATTAYLQRRDEPGSATMVGSVAPEEEALDRESFTKLLTAEQNQDQTPSEQELMEVIEEKTGVTNFVLNRITKHPSMAQMGVKPKHIKGFKVGVYIGNSGYKYISNLSGVKGDVERMKSTMEALNYDSMPFQMDKSASELDSILSLGVQHAKTFGADGLLLYYAGHGLPEGLLGINAREKLSAPDSENQEQGDGGRGIKISPDVEDVEPYSKVMQHLAGSVANGVHTTLIVDACHSGAGTELLRDKAVERVSEKGSLRSQAIMNQINRLEDIKEQNMIIALRNSTGTTSTSRAGGLSSRGGIVDQPITLPTEGESTSYRSLYHEYWSKIVYPELQQVNTYLTEAGLGLDLPSTLSTYSLESIQQQINFFINKLIKLAETIQQEEEESVLEKVGT